MSGYGDPPSYGGTPQSYVPAGEPPSNNLVWAILTTIFCCLPLGIVSIVYAAQVNSKWMGGDVNGAVESANKARQWAVISGVVGIVVIVLWFVLVFWAGLTFRPTTTNDF